MMSWRYRGGVTAPRSDATMRRTYAWTSKAACFNGRPSNENTRSGPPGRPGQLQLGVAQTLDGIAKGRGLLEVEVRGRRLHVVPQRRDVLVQFGLRPELLRAVGQRGGRRHVIPLVDARHHLVDLLDDRLRGDAVLLV